MTWRVVFEDWDLFWLLIYFVISFPAFMYISRGLAHWIVWKAENIFRRLTQKRVPIDPKYAPPEHFNCRCVLTPTEDETTRGNDGPGDEKTV